jgi:dienelactone hydrolase
VSGEVGRIDLAACRQATREELLALFSARPFTAAQDRRGRPITHEVLESEASDDARPSVVVLHELPGLSLEALRFGRCLVDAGFRVHLPLLYGESGRGSMVGGTRDALWCLRHELDLFTRGAASPLVDWVRALVRDVASSGPVRVGIVGMCMTGGIAVAALAEGATGAAVASQPSLPVRPPCRSLRGRADLGIDEPTLAAAVASPAPLLALRYDRDAISAAERFATLRERFTDGSPPALTAPAPDVRVQAWERLRLVTVQGNRHAVLTLHPNEPAILETIRFLAEHLGAAGDAPTSPADPVR